MAVAAAILLAGGLSPTSGCTDRSAEAGGQPSDADPAASVTAPWAWQLPGCVAYRETDYESPKHRLDAQTRQAADTVEYVEIYQPGWGERAVSEIRAVLDECATYEAGGSGDPEAFREQYVIVETGFAGDESLLIEVVRQNPPELQTSYAVVVRRGEQVVTVRGAETAIAQATCLAVLATCPA